MEIPPPPPPPTHTHTHAHTYTHVLGRRSAAHGGMEDLLKLILFKRSLFALGVSA